MYGQAKYAQIVLAARGLRRENLTEKGTDTEQSPESLPLNDETDYGLCFACGPRHPSGLRLVFHRDGSRVTTTFTAEEAHQGFPGYLHGGIISTILDEVMSRVTVLDNRWSLTARLDVRFREPVGTGQAITAIGEKVRVRGRFVETRGKVETPDGTVVADAVGRYAYVPDEALARIAEGYPRLREEWMVNR